MIVAAAACSCPPSSPPSLPPYLPSSLNSPCTPPSLALCCLNFILVFFPIIFILYFSSLSLFSLCAFLWLNSLKLRIKNYTQQNGEQLRSLCCLQLDSLCDLTGKLLVRLFFIKPQYRLPWRLVSFSPWQQHERHFHSTKRSLRQGERCGAVWGGGL